MQAYYIFYPLFWQAGASSRLISLSTVDGIIIALYFVAVIGIGFYLKRFTKTGEDFFLAGREMTAWIAGLSFVAANLGSLELMGWAASSYQYGILAAHWYWIGAIPAMLFLGLVMMPFYYISKTHSVPGYLKLRFGEPARALSAISFGFMTVLMSGINMYLHGHGDERHARLGYRLQHLGFVRSPSRPMSSSAACSRPSSMKCCSSFSSGWARCSSPSSA